ncbi:hypothetical protein B0I35DRAFT_355760 [Stachybotrys elegans]|uniref:ABC transporter domain-containing protein n=1 Tax=Stachybotrys elegans TaxID=80388 RepID=A0A8K0WPJ5_9HYPO|nr:hypothetical protein B0I35DRAFT_355760 [Stachybotrys elegans]
MSGGIPQAIPLQQLERSFGPLPQNPFYPRLILTEPAFLDTSACRCTLELADFQAAEDEAETQAAWRCVGDPDHPPYQQNGFGKWYKARNGGTAVTGRINDNSNPPLPDERFLYDSGRRLLVRERDYRGNPLEGWDQACTGRNHSSFSTSYYQATAQQQASERVTAAASCWRPGAVPLQIQTAEDWVNNGCSAGFLCANNTVNSLPQYCPPWGFCQSSRLAGEICQLDGNNVPMGQFEPVVCQAGSYCPVESEGMESIKCPSGHYCQPGAATPTPCSLGSSCPEGSVRQLLLLPIIILIVVDVLLVVGFAFLKLRGRFRSSARTNLGSTKRSPRGLMHTNTGYKTLEDETEGEADQEMLQIGSSYMPGQDTFTGFEAALAMEALQAMDEEVPNDDLPPQLRVFVESMRKATDATNFGLSFGYSGLKFQPRGVQNPILQNVTGSINRGSLAAVMGGSGAGKSTFVNVLMGKISHTGGLVTVNNEAVKIARFKKLIGYVPQDDIVLPELTVFENILHSARIRLPRKWTQDEVRAHVDAVIDCLELSHVRDSLVGSPAAPVLSGGQRKRVSIGMELAAAPMAIFLDEPTSGLDATAASSIMRTLKALARLGISVIVIIHQPRVEIFDMLDNLILLGNGQTIYEGPQSECRAYFEKIGFSFPEHSNHGDVVTDIITGNGRPYKRVGEISKQSLISHWATTRHAERGEATENEDRFSLRLSDFVPMPRPQAVKNRGAAAPYQVWLSIKRASLQQYRALGSLAVEMALCTLAGILLGLAQYARNGVLFRGLYNPPYDSLSVALDFRAAPEVALLVAIAIGLTSGAPGVRVFSEEMLLARREAEAGHSRLAYFVAKVLSVIPRMALACLHFTAPLFFLMAPIMDWGIAYVANLLYFYCIYGLASIVSMIVRREDAPLFSTMIALITGILSGSAPSLRQARDWNMEWLWRASPGTWLAELYFSQLVEPFRYLYQVDMASQHTGFHLNWFWQNMLTLFGIGTIYRLIAFGAMISLPRLRK